MKQVKPWKRAVLLLIGLANLGLSIFLIVHARDDHQFEIVAAVFGVLIGGVGIWYIACGSAQKVRKALLGLDKGVSGGI